MDHEDRRDGEVPQLRFTNPNPRRPGGRGRPQTGTGRPQAPRTHRLLTGRPPPRGPRRDRTRLAGPIILALLALAGLVASVSSAEGPRPAHIPPPKRPQALIPANGQRLRYGAEVKGSCASVNHAERNDMRGWGVYTFDPGRAPVIGPAGRTLLPTSFTGFADPPGLDGFASGSTRPADLTQWQVAGVARQMPASPGAGCSSSISVVNPDGIRSGSAVALRRPGPYVYWTFDHTVRWVRVSDYVPEPTPLPCAQDPDQSARNPAPVGAPPSSGGNGWHWAVTSFCTTVKWWSFSVLGPPGRCPLATDTSMWPRSDYINQYAAGQRLSLPLGRGEAGGNACGPSALLMAMLQSQRSASRSRSAQATRAATLPALPTVFDLTMSLTRAQVTPDSFNEFVGARAGQLLRQLGWTEATLGRLGSNADSIANETAGSDVDPSNQAAIDRALDHGPLIISTDLGTEPWGTTGSGHMIVVLGPDPDDPGEYIVYDPAGNYFSDPVNHYGPGSCGSGVLYPRSWLIAFTTGGWFIELGAPPRRVTS